MLFIGLYLVNGVENETFSIHSYTYVKHQLNSWLYHFVILLCSVYRLFTHTGLTVGGYLFSTMFDGAFVSLRCVYVMFILYYLHHCIPVLTLSGLVIFVAQ